MDDIAKNIVEILQKKGFTAVFAGGYVRDMILGKKSNDIDIATNAKPEEIEKIFPKTFPLGKSFGVVVVRQEGINFEVATFRSDNGIGDGRRPDFIEYSDIKNDAFRRDFTINGIFFDPISKEIIDYVEGKRDLKRGLLRFIGDPERRISEDFLRIMRAIRFKNRLNLAYEKNTKAAIKKHASSIFMVSSERILQELNKIIQHHSRSEALKDMLNTSLLEHIIPEITAMKNTFQPKDHHSEGDVFTHTLLALKNIPEGESLALYWAMFFHDIGKSIVKKFDGVRWRYSDHEKKGAQKTREILQKLNASKTLREKVCWLISHENIFDDFFKMKLATRLQYYDHAYFSDLLKLHKYDVLGSIPTGEKNKISKKKRLQMIDQIEKNLVFVQQNKLLPSHNPEFFSGKDIMNICNIPPSKKVGDILKTLREAQMNNEIKNTQQAKSFILSLCSEK